MQHIPVLSAEVLDGLNLSPGASAIDATLGLGGHAGLILEAIGPDGRLFAFDRDQSNLEAAKKNLASHANVEYFHDSFGHMNAYALPHVDAILMDLGFSSVHVDDATRGFSFQNDGPLDMRYDRRQELTAEHIVNGWSKDELAALFRKLGEERFAPQIAKAIFDARRKQRITTTRQLADVVAGAKKRRGKVHPATQVFQALRIAVNDELSEVEKGLRAAVGLLKPEGRLAIISFHSLEDRFVKQFFKATEELEILTKKPIKPSYKETRVNPRARSAKLRIAQKR